MVNVLVIDDHPLVTGGISVMLQNRQDIAVSGSAQTAREALSLLEKNSYDIILLDISLPDMDGLSLCREIRKQDKTIKIIGLTSTNETGIITQLLREGANGFLLKNMDRTELLEAVFQTLKGKIYLSKAANEKVLEQFVSIDNSISQPPLLTRREKEILQLLNEGYTGPQIAQKLFLSPYTIETHRKNLMQKLNATNSRLLLKLARQNKLIE
ncbi:MAG: response regulator transcription factor [Chitinophagaceae bacterium]|nr:response regulator transcription factor [Chitinophagaceae bacterium]